MNIWIGQFLLNGCWQNYCQSCNNANNRCEHTKTRNQIYHKFLGLVLFPCNATVRLLHSWPFQVTCPCASMTTCLQGINRRKQKRNRTAKTCIGRVDFIDMQSCRRRGYPQQFIYTVLLIQLDIAHARACNHTRCCCLTMRCRTAAAITGGTA